ncbi:MAG: molybdenum cofactor sulfurase [Devosia sp.]
MIEFAPARTLEATVAGVYAVSGEELASTAVDSLALTYDGIRGDRHAGLTRRSGAREPWYPRGTPMRNERQVSILSVEEMAEVAHDLGIPALPAEWIGSNLLLSGVAGLSLLPPRTILMFASGAAVRIDGDNGPCRASGRSIAAKTGSAKHEFEFVKAALHKRGLVGWVEREGPVNPGDSVKIRVWEQPIAG